MTLTDYFATTPGSQAALAHALGLQIAQVWQWKEGVRPVPLAYINKIETATAGAVRRWDLRPADWADIWPELVGAPGAPAVPEKAGA